MQVAKAGFVAVAAGALCRYAVENEEIPGFNRVGPPLWA